MARPRGQCPGRGPAGVLRIKRKSVQSPRPRTGSRGRSLRAAADRPRGRRRGFRPMTPRRRFRTVNPLRLGVAVAVEIPDGANPEIANSRFHLGAIPYNENHLLVGPHDLAYDL